MTTLATRGNVQQLAILTATLSPAIVAANTSAEQTFTVTGLQTSDVIVAVVKPTHQAGLAIVGWNCSAANTLAIRFGNFTGAGVTPTASEAYRVVVMRPELPLGSVIRP